jgi:hypothetical protein
MENFDKKIKQKLESVQPPFEEQAWRKLKAALPVPWYIQLFQGAGGWLFGGVASLALLGTLFTNYQQKRENEQLNGEISTLKEKVTTVYKTDTVFVEKLRIDTVYVVKVIREKIAETTLPTEELYENNRSQKIQQKLTKTTVVDNEKTAIVQQENTTDEEEAKSKLKPLETIEKEGNVFREKPEMTKEKVEIENQVPISELFIPEKKQDTTQAATETKAKKSFKLPYIPTRLGLTSDYLGLQTLASGVGIELFLVKNLSVNTGILLAKSKEVEHKRPKDFNDATGKRFEDQFKDFVPPQRQIEDIKIETSFIKLPIALQYYLPTKSNFSFMVVAGTKLDLSIYQDIEFASTGSGDRQKSKFQNKPNVQVFNDFHYGMGVQYQYKRFVGQLSPYFDFRFRKNDYLQNPRNFGVNAALKYDFSK